MIRASLLMLLLAGCASARPATPACSGPQLRALGTEPFWSVRVAGSCLTYTHPEDQAGTIVQTRYAEQAGERRWSGMLAGQPLVLKIRPQPGCSDGMSDRSYPFAAELLVKDELRRGCAH